MRFNLTGYVFEMDDQQISAVGGEFNTATLLNADKTMKTPDETRAVFQAAGVDLAKPIITSCGSGITAAILALALERMGHDQWSLYDGSWAEWGMSPMVPVATGDA